MNELANSPHRAAWIEMNAEKIAQEISSEVLGDYSVTLAGKGEKDIAAIIDKYLLPLQQDNDDLLKRLKVVITHINQGRKLEKRVPLWSAVADFCGLGSTSAGKLCQRLGFNDDLMVGKENPPK